MKRTFLAVVFLAALALPAWLPGQQKQTQSFTITISPATAVSISTAASAVTNGVATVAYTPVVFAATGGVAPYTWSISAGALPGGMTFTGGTLAGTPTAIGTFTFTVKVADSESPAQTATAQYTTIVATLLKIGATTVPNGTVGTAYSQLVPASGGTAPYNCYVNVTIPGLAFTSGANGCTLAGTPTTAGSYPFVLTVEDSGTGTYTAVKPRASTISLTIRGN